MPKDVNIHIKTPGASEAKADLESTTRGVQKVGEEVEKTGSRSERALGWIGRGIKNLIGPLGFAAIITTVAAVAGKVASFFDELKSRCDEAVRNLQNVRKGFEGLFEAMGAFDEASRQQVSKGAMGLLQKTAVSAEVGLPVIEAYARQFRGKMPEAQYQRGLEGMLGYAARHGGAATPELVSLMAGWGMGTPESQGAFRRQVAAAAGVSGLTDADVFMALGRGMPTIKALGWSPAQALSSIATIAQGEVGRVKSSLPATTLQAIMAPQVSDLEKYGVTEAEAQNPQLLLQRIAAKSQAMDQQAVNRMLVGIYGQEAAKGVYKLITPSQIGVEDALKRAATGRGIAEETAEEAASRQTEERLLAQTEARKNLADMEITDRWRYGQKVRVVGEAEKRRYQREQPVRQWLQELTTVGNQAESEEAAFRRWHESLSPDERDAIRGYVWEIDPLKTDRYGGGRYVWNQMSPKQRFESLTGGPRVPITVINNHYHSEIVYNPVAGTASDREIGPHAGRDLR